MPSLVRATCALVLFASLPLAQAQTVESLEVASCDAFVAVDDLTVYRGALYFQAQFFDTPGQLYRYSAAGGVERVDGIGPDDPVEDPADLVVYDDALYFRAEGADAGRELYRYTPEDGVSLAADVQAGGQGASPEELTVTDGALYFRARREGVGEELFRFTEADGATLAVDIVPGPTGGGPTDLVAYDGALYFAAGGQGDGRELYRYTDADGLVLAADVWPGPGSSLPYGLTVVGGALYFRADDGTTGPEPYRFTPHDGASLLADLNPDRGSNPGRFIGYDGDVILTASPTGSFSTAALYRSEPGGATTRLDLEGIEEETATPIGLVVFDGALYLSLSAGDLGRELVRYTSDGAVEIFDVVPGMGGLAPQRFQVYDGALYFRGDDQASGGLDLYRFVPAATSVEAPRPFASGLSAPRPNPTAARATLDLTAPVGERVRVTVVDVLGREVAVAFDGVVPASAEVAVDLSAQPSGLYVVRVQGERVSGARVLTVAR